MRYNSYGSSAVNAKLNWWLRLKTCYKKYVLYKKKIKWKWQALRNGYNGYEVM